MGKDSNMPVGGRMKVTGMSSSPSGMHWCNQTLWNMKWHHVMGKVSAHVGSIPDVSLMDMAPLVTKSVSLEAVMVVAIPILKLCLED